MAIVAEEMDSRWGGGAMAIGRGGVRRGAMAMGVRAVVRRGAMAMGRMRGVRRSAMCVGARFVAA
jgi:hypothetical protein